jgi:hypothetical protein
MTAALAWERVQTTGAGRWSLCGRLVDAAKQSLLCRYWFSRPMRADDESGGRGHLEDTGELRLNQHQALVLHALVGEDLFAVPLRPFEVPPTKTVYRFNPCRSASTGK